MTDHPEIRLPAKRYPNSHIIIGVPPQLVKFEYRSVLPASELVALCQTIKNTLYDKPCQVVQIASAYYGEGTNTIAFETALAAATQIGLRVLYIETGYEADYLPKQLTDHIDTSIDVLLKAGGDLKNTCIGIEGTQFVYSVLRNTQFKDSVLASMEDFKDLIDTLRSMYDLIIIPSAGVLNDVLCASIARLVDGTIVVVEAERTRAPVVMQLKESITKNGGRIIGSILNRQRLYIPRWLYRFI